jgi:hypothetical protein
MGFAPPPHDGFAFLASAHTDAHTLLRTSPYIGSQPHAIQSSKEYCACRRCSPVLDCATRCLSHARLVSKGQAIPNEFLAQLPRMPKRRSSQNSLTPQFGQ